jgi:hypothetical protein
MQRVRLFVSARPIACVFLSVAGENVAQWHLERRVQREALMPHTLVDGLSLVDATGRTILLTTVSCLFLAIVANLWARARYASLGRDLARSAGPPRQAVLKRVFDEALAAARRGSPPNTQAIIEQCFVTELRPLLLAERFVKAATGLVIILGLLGTFYGLSLSIGRIVQLVSADSGASADVAGAVTTGLQHALAGMAVAFSNSLVGILSAVVLTVVGVFSSPTDRRVALMLELETHVDRLLVTSGASAQHGGGSDAQTVARLENVVARFEAALTNFAASTSSFQEFNAHLKDNIQRMSLSFGDFSDALKSQVGALKRHDGR